MTTWASPADGPIASVGSGTRLANRYELRRPLASGGMAQVWLANDTVLDRLVAAKVLHPHLATDAGFVERFRREAVAAARLSHPSIVAIYDTISSGGVEAIVMELIDGRTLRALLDETGALPIGQVLHIGISIASALDEAHRAGIVHRDIKPANIMMAIDGRAMVTDFGIAKAGTDSDLTATGTLIGTAKYLAPEQVTGDLVDPRSDLYSLGVVLFECLAGVPPFRADTDAATALARLHQDPPPLRALRPNVPPELEAIVAKLTARWPPDRFPRASALQEALSRLRTNLPGGADTGPPPPPSILTPAEVAAVTTEPPPVAPDRGGAASSNGTSPSAPPSGGGTSDNTIEGDFDPLATEPIDRSEVGRRKPPLPPAGTVVGPPSAPVTAPAASPFPPPADPGGGPTRPAEPPSGQGPQPPASIGTFVPTPPRPASPPTGDAPDPSAAPPFPTHPTSGPLPSGPPVSPDRPTSGPLPSAPPTSPDRPTSGPLPGGPPAYPGGGPGGPGGPATAVLTSGTVERADGATSVLNNPAPPLGTGPGPGFQPPDGPGPWGPPGPVTPSGPTARSGRRWSLAVLAGVVVVAGLIGGVLLASQRRGGNVPKPPDRPASTVAIGSALSFDPLTTDDNKDENPKSVPLAFDGKPETFWATATYRQPHFGGLKAGVGLILDLGQSATLQQMELTTNTQGWTAEVYLSDTDFGPDPASWGEPAARVVSGGASEQVALNGAAGSKVLLWLTEPGQSGGKNRFELDEIVLR